MKTCISCGTSAPEKWWGRKCSRCYRREYYQSDIENQRAMRRISSKKYYCTPIGRFNHSKRTANIRKLVWLLTKEDYFMLLTKCCVYCEGPLSPMGVGLDRINNDLGYTSVNVQPCCGVCNRIRGDNMTCEEMHSVANLLKEIRAA